MLRNPGIGLLITGSAVVVVLTSCRKIELRVVTLATGRDRHRTATVIPSEEMHEDRMLLAVLRLHKESADDHRISLKSVRNRLHFHFVYLMSRSALYFCQVHGLPFLKFRKLSLDTLPIFIKVRLHVRLGYDLIWRNSEIIAGNGLIIFLYPCGHPSGRLVESRNKFLLGHKFQIRATVGRHFHIALDGSELITLVRHYIQFDLCCDDRVIRIVQVHSESRLAFKYPACIHLQRRLERCQLKRLGLFSLIRSRKRFRILTAHSHCRKHKCSKKKQQILFHDLSYFISFLIFLESSAFSYMPTKSSA